jgi:hypothetical protein
MGTEAASKTDMSLGHASICLVPTTQGLPGVDALSTWRRFLPSQPRSPIRGDLDASEEGECWRSWGQDIAAAGGLASRPCGLEGLTRCDIVTPH